MPPRFEFGGDGLLGLDSLHQDRQHHEHEKCREWNIRQRRPVYAVRSGAFLTASGAEPDARRLDLACKRPREMIDSRKANSGDAVPTSRRAWHATKNGW